MHISISFFLDRRSINDWLMNSIQFCWRTLNFFPDAKSARIHEPQLLCEYPVKKNHTKAGATTAQRYAPLSNKPS